jgi:methionyl-tRNA formyltransferase
MGIPILQPEDLRDPFFLRAIQGYNPDIAAVVAFRILPTELFTIPKKGCVNLHASLLPELRGAAPIQWALIRGYRQTGVSTFLIERKVDTGGLLSQSIVTIEQEDNAGTLSRKLSDVGAELLIESLQKVNAGTSKPQQQTGEPTLAPKITKELCRISWERSALDIHNQIRGLSPLPAAHTYLNDKMVKIFRSQVVEAITSDPGAITTQNEGQLLIGTGAGCLLIEELQLEGRKRMSASEFLRGKSIAAGTHLK